MFGFCTRYYFYYYFCLIDYQFARQPALKPLENHYYFAFVLALASAVNFSALGASSLGM